MKRKHDRGSVLISVIVLLILASMGVMATTLLIQNYAQAQAKIRDEMRAFHAAEAGPMEVVSWFNTSGSVILQAYPTKTYFASLFARDTASTTTPYSRLDKALREASHNGIDVKQVEPGLLPTLTNKQGKQVGQVTDLHLYHHNFDPLAGTHVPIPDVVCIVNSTGVTPSGSEKEVWLYLTPWWMEGAPAAIVSRAAVNFGGNAMGHWGEVWAESNCEMVAESQAKKVLVPEDPWLKFRSEAKIYFDSTWGVDKWGKPFYTESGHDVVGVLNGAHPPYPTDGVVIKGVDYTGRTEQFTTLDWPHYDYNLFKNLAMRKGRYFRTDAAGNLYRDGIIDEAHKVSDPARELNTGTLEDRSDDPALWEKVKYDIIFVDTIDGNPPNAAGTNLATLKINGAGMSWKGFYYLNMNMELAGSPTSNIPCKDPNGVYQGLKAFCDGIFVSTGWIDVTGNPIIYGSCYAERGWGGTGTVDVYYNVELANGFPVPLHPMVATKFKVER